MDVRGRGQSWQAPGPFTLAQIADDVVTTLDFFGLNQTVVVGYSMGAWVAALFGTRHPERTERVVLVDGGLPIEFPAHLGPDQVLHAVVGPALLRLDLDFDSKPDYFDWWKTHPSIAGRWTADMEDIFSYDIHQVGTVWKPRANKTAVSETGADMALHSETVEAWERLRVPTDLIVVDHGMIDEPGGFMPFGLAQAATAANPNIRIHPIEEANHYTVLLGGGAEETATIIAAG
jgi:pimeloyl-ACP methyl ester carboxylesterase